jgi:protein-serine/threonine kinase
MGTCISRVCEFLAGKPAKQNPQHYIEMHEPILEKNEGKYDYFTPQNLKTKPFTTDNDFTSTKSNISENENPLKLHTNNNLRKTDNYYFYNSNSNNILKSGGNLLLDNSKSRNKQKQLSSSLKSQMTKTNLNDFQSLKILGKGSFGKVFLVRNVNDNLFYAMKVLKKERIYKTNQIIHTKTEREILEKVNHPFIVKMFYAFQTEQKLYLVTEFMQGGELFSI